MTPPPPLRMAAAFDEAFTRRAPDLTIRAETEADAVFLRDLFGRCSPMRDILSPEMLAAQWRLQHESHQGAHPNAMRRIIFAAGAPIGRIVIDWTPNDHSHGIDLAVDPDRRHGGGLALLRSWLEVADAWDRPCRLTVLPTNPAGRIYTRLGFQPEQGFVAGTPLLVMTRPVRQRASPSAINA